MIRRAGAAGLVARQSIRAVPPLPSFTNYFVGLPLISFLIYRRSIAQSMSTPAPAGSANGPPPLLEVRHGHRPCRWRTACGSRDVTGRRADSLAARTRGKPALSSREHRLQRVAGAAGLQPVGSARRRPAEWRTSDAGELQRTCLPFRRSKARRKVLAAVARRVVQLRRRQALASARRERRRATLARQLRRAGRRTLRLSEPFGRTGVWRRAH